MMIPQSKQAVLTTVCQQENAPCIFSRPSWFYLGSGNDNVVICRLFP